MSRFNRYQDSASSSTWTYSVWIKGDIPDGDSSYLMGWTGTGGQLSGFAHNQGSNPWIYLWNGTANLSNPNAFRDYSGWMHYHIKCNSGSAQAFINGQQVVGTVSYQAPDAGLVTIMDWISGGNKLRGSAMDLYYVDGQALDYDVFTKEVNGQLVPKNPNGVKTAIGNFGTNGFYYPLQPHTTTSIITDGLVEAYNWEQSLNGYLGNHNLTVDAGGASFSTHRAVGNHSQRMDNDTFSTGISLGDQYSISFFMRRRSGIGDLYRRIITTTTGGFGSTFCFRENSGGNMDYVWTGTGGSTILHRNLPASTYEQWNHHVLVVDGVSSTKYFKHYVDGVLVYHQTATSFTTPEAGLYLGGRYDIGAEYFDGWMDAVRIYNRPVTESEILTLYKESPMAFSIDESGNNNHAIKIGFEQDRNSTNYYLNAVQETPNNKFCTFDNNTEAVVSGAPDCTIGNLFVQSSNSNKHIRGTMGVNSGKWYWEFKTTASAPDAHHGVSSGDTLRELEVAGMNYMGQISQNWAYYILASNPLFRNSGGYAPSIGGMAANDVAMVALDMDNGKIWFGKNGTWSDSGNPAGNSNPSFSNLPTDGTMVYPHAMPYDSTGGELYDFGQGVLGGNNADDNGRGKFVYSPPSGFLSLCTANLPDPSIAEPKQHHNTLMWIGDGSSTRSLTGLGFQPDLIIEKITNGNTFQWDVVDSVRGGNRVSHTNSTNAEDVNFVYGYVSSFDSDGFTMTAGSSSIENWNQTLYTYTAFCWKGGNGNTSNSDGTITSTVSANTDAGFSVVGYTGNGSSTATVGHGLGATPTFMLSKTRNTGYYWRVYHSYFGTTPTAGLLLNNDALGTGGSYNHDVAGGIGSVNNNTFGFASSSWGGAAVNGNGTEMITYCWTDIPGYSKTGSYKGNGNADGPYVNCGFKPALVIIKRVDTSGSWCVLSNINDGFNGNNDQLQLHSTGTEDEGSSGQFIDFYSNGFKLKNTATDKNASAGTYIYVAWAESPFKYATAR